MSNQSTVSRWIWLVVTLVVLPVPAALLLGNAASAAPAKKSTRVFDATSQAAEF